MAEQKRPKPVLTFHLEPIRKVKGMSKRQLHKVSGIPYPMICRLAKPSANPTWHTDMKLAAALDCSPGDFVKPPKKGSTA